MIRCPRKSMQLSGQWTRG